MVAGMMGAAANQGWLSELLSDPLLMDVFAGTSTVMAYGQKPTAAQIAERMSQTQYDTYGDPSNWKPRGEKPGSGRPGRDGDIKIYDLWEYARNRLVEVHYFVNQAGSLKEWTVRVHKHSP